MTYSERARCVTGCCPAPAAVETKSFVRDDPEQSATSECLGVCLALDLKNIQGQQNDFTDADKTASCRVHYCLSIAFAECAVEALTVVLRQVVPSERLAAVLVNTLENLL